MSKSLGNGIDPLLMIDQYSADSVRVSLMLLSAEGQDINLAENDFELGRNLSNKIWNANRLLAMNTGDTRLDARPADIAELPDEELADRWIKSRYYQTVRTVTEGLTQYRLHEAIAAIYDFFWHDYCDWYLELIKGRLGTEGDGESRTVPLQLATGIMEGSMLLLHPFMPFITEEIWQSIGDYGRQSIMVTPWPAMREDALDAEAERQMKQLQDVINALRNIRGEMSIPPGKRIGVVFKVSDEDTQSLLEDNQSYLAALARTNELTISAEPDIPQPAARAFLPGIEIHVPLADVIDIAKEKERLEKGINRVEGEIASHDKKLSNEKFLSKAPEHVVDMTRRKREELAEKAEKLRESLRRLH
jgi:valyl-tRNA synthetase